MFFVIMVLVAMRIFPFQALLTALSSARERGALMSLVVAIGQVGGGLGGAVAGWIYADAGFSGCTLLAAAAITVTGLIVWTRIPSRRRSRLRDAHQPLRASVEPPRYFPVPTCDPCRDGRQLPTMWTIFAAPVGWPWRRRGA